MEPHDWLEILFPFGLGIALLVGIFATFGVLGAITYFSANLVLQFFGVPC